MKTVGVLIILLLVGVTFFLVVRAKLRKTDVGGTVFDKALSREKRLDALEKLLSARAGRVLLFSVVLVGVAGVLAYAASSDAKLALEYLSYMMPCIGGGVAAYAVYKKNRPNTLFALSLLFVFIGMGFFIGSHSNAVLVSATSIEAFSAILLFLLCATFFRLSDKPADQRRRMAELPRGRTHHRGALRNVFHDPECAVSRRRAFFRMHGALVVLNQPE